MGEEKTMIYAIMFACIIGIILVAILVISTTPFSESFTELYFENHEKLPNKIVVGKEEEFDFTVFSHEDKKMSYDYKVKFDNLTLDQGSFSLSPEEKKTISVTFSPQPLPPSVILTGNITTIDHSHITYDNLYDEKILLPLKFPVAGNENSTHILELDPNSKEEYIFESTVKEPVTEILINLNSTNKGRNPCWFKVDQISQISEDLTKHVISNKIDLVPQSGFNLVNLTTTVSNNYGNIQVDYKKTVLEYRYEFNKVSVEVSTDKADYEIYFWTRV